MNSSEKGIQIASLLKAIHSSIATFHRTLISCAPLPLDESKLSPQVLTYFETFRYSDFDTSSSLQNVTPICSDNPSQTLPQFLQAFPLISMTLTTPVLPERDLRRSVFAQLPPAKDLVACASCHVIIQTLVTDFSQLLMPKLGDASAETHACLYPHITRYLCTESDDDVAICLKQIFVNLWSKVINMVS
jgi:hypothetical protein